MKQGTINRKWAFRGMMLVLVVIAAACAQQPDTYSSAGSPGFILGLIQGFLCVFAFIGSFFTEASVYAFPNSGWSYDLGFLIGCGLFFGGASSSS